MTALLLLPSTVLSFCGRYSGQRCSLNLIFTAPGFGSAARRDVFCRAHATVAAGNHKQMASYLQIECKHPNRAASASWPADTRMRRGVGLYTWQRATAAAV